MIIITPLAGSIGEIKAPAAIPTVGIKLIHPDFKLIYEKLDKNDRIRGAMTGIFDYNWEYIPDEQAYLLKVDYYRGHVQFGVKFPKNTAGQILQALVDSGKRVFGLVLKFNEESRMIFDDAVVLLGIEFDIEKEAGWPVVKNANCKN